MGLRIFEERNKLCGLTLIVVAVLWVEELKLVKLIFGKLRASMFEIEGEAMCKARNYSPSTTVEELIIRKVTINKETGTFEDEGTKSVLKFVETSFAGLIYSTSVSILEKGAGFCPFVHVTSTPHHVLIIYNCRINFNLF